MPPPCPLSSSAHQILQTPLVTAQKHSSAPALYPIEAAPPPHFVLHRPLAQHRPSKTFLLLLQVSHDNHDLQRFIASCESITQPIQPIPPATFATASLAPTKPPACIEETRGNWLANRKTKPRLTFRFRLRRSSSREEYGPRLEILPPLHCSASPTVAIFIILSCRPESVPARPS